VAKIAIFRFIIMVSFNWIKFRLIVKFNFTTINYFELFNLIELITIVNLTFQIKTFYNLLIKIVFKGIHYYFEHFRRIDNHKTLNKFNLLI
jgi:hypothetical protein